MFLNYKVHHLSHFFSDHSPILLNMKADSSLGKMFHFRFEVAWLLEGTCEEEVKKMWADNVDWVSVRLRKVGERLEKWFKRIKKIQNVNKEGT